MYIEMLKDLIEKGELLKSRLRIYGKTEESAEKYLARMGYIDIRSDEEKAYDAVADCMRKIDSKRRILASLWEGGINVIVEGGYDSEYGNQTEIRLKEEIEELKRSLDEETLEMAKKEAIFRGGDKSRRMIDFIYGYQNGNL